MTTDKILIAECSRVLVEEKDGRLRPSHFENDRTTPHFMLIAPVCIYRMEIV